MSTPTGHYKEEIQDWLDQRLDAATREEVERHLETCAECRREYEVLSWTKQFAARQFAPKAAPADLRADIVRALHAEEPARNVVRLPPGFWRSRRRSLLAVAALLIAALTSLYVFRPTPLPEVMMRDYRAYLTGRLTLQLTTSNVKEMETFFAAQGVPFQTRVFDLNMMNYRLVGGRELSPKRHQRAAFVYTGPRGQFLLCQMFVGQVANLPAGAQQLEHKGIKFYAYRHKGLTAVFWQEGAIVCALVSDITPDEVTELAFAKAESI